MNRIAAIALSVAATLFTTGSAIAQDHAVKATIPFSFSVNGNWVPSGTYTVSSDSNSSTVLRMSCRDQKINVLALGQMDSKDPGDRGELVFHEYGGQYFLSEIRYPHSSAKVRFIPTRAEKRAKEGTLESGLRIDSDVLVAFN